MSQLEYDADVIREFAATLYGRAKWTVWIYSAMWAIGALAFGYFLFPQPYKDVGALILMGIGALAGQNLGRGKAFQLKLEAQTALTQVQIEVNTRS